MLLRAAAALLLAACAGRTVPPSAPSACRLPFESGVGEAELGFSLARLADEVPRTLDGLRAFVEQHGGKREVKLEQQAQAQAREPALASVAGAPACAFDDETLARREGPARLQRPVPSPALEERLKQGARELAAGHLPEARATYAAAARLGPGVPAHLLAVGDAYAEERRWADATRVYEAAAATFPWSAAARLRLARVLRREGRVQESIRTLARALALRPGSAELRATLAGERTAELAPPVPPPAERSGSGWVTRAEGEHALAEARAYAACKEAFRSSEELRLRATALSGPWRWTVGEETACSALWLAAYVRNREQGRPADPTLDGLWQVAQAGLLDERSVFDVGGPIHAEAAALLDDERRERLFTFVAKYRAGPRESGGFLIF